MFKKISSLLNVRLKLKLITIFFGNLIVTSLEFLSLASVPLAIGLLLNTGNNEIDLPIIKDLIKNIKFEENSYGVFFIILFFYFYSKIFFWNHNVFRSKI